MDIKLRAWDGKRMIYLSDLSIGLKKGKRISPYAYFAKDNFGNQVSLAKHDVMLFSGVLDKNGKEIYGGDISKDGVVAWSNQIGYDGGGGMHSGFYIENRSTKEEGLEYIDLDYHLALTEIEVIGNIYENPELLK